MSLKEDDSPFARGVLHALQLVAMGLCALIVYEMLISSALSIPQRMCVDGAYARPAEEP